MRAGSERQRFMATRALCHGLVRPRYGAWFAEHIFVMYPPQGFAAEQIQSFAEFPPRQKPAAFNLDSVLEQMDDAGGGGLH